MQEEFFQIFQYLQGFSVFMHTSAFDLAVDKIQLHVFFYACMMYMDTPADNLHSNKQNQAKLSSSYKPVINILSS